MADGYPILVEKWPHAGASLDMGCNGCGRHWHESDPNEFMRKVEVGCCSCGSFDIEPRYEEGVRCKSCGALDYSQEVDGCCSRKCALQAEYAEKLKTQDAAVEQVREAVRMQPQGPLF